MTWQALLDWLHSPPPHRSTASAALALGGAVVGYLLPHPTTIVHELGHTVIAILVRRRVMGIKLHSDSSGVTTSRGSGRGPGMLLVVLAGYPAPFAAGLGLIWAWSSGHSRAGLVLLLALLGLALLLIRSWFGLVIVPVCLAVTAWAAFQPRPEAQALTCVLSGAGLIGGGCRGLLSAWRSWRRPSETFSDADQLRHLTHLPAAVWLTVFTTAGVAITAVAISFLLLLLPTFS